MRSKITSLFSTARMSVAQIVKKEKQVCCAASLHVAKLRAKGFEGILTQILRKN